MTAELCPFCFECRIDTSNLRDFHQRELHHVRLAQHVRQSLARSHVSPPTVEAASDEGCQLLDLFIVVCIEHCASQLFTANP